MALNNVDLDEDPETWIKKIVDILDDEEVSEILEDLEKDEKIDNNVFEEMERVNLEVREIFNNSIKQQDYDTVGKYLKQQKSF